MLDILIRNGRMVDGTGNPWFPGDLGIEGDHIAAVGDLAGAAAHKTIDAAGKIIAPGIVDCHAHSERTILANRGALSSLYQGVTTEIAGNCGMGFAPITDQSRDSMRRFIAFFTPEAPVDWSSFGEWLDHMESGIGINMGMQVGHHTIRRAVMGMEARPPTEDEMQRMERLVAESLDEGAIGLSFGRNSCPVGSPKRESCAGFAFRPPSETR